MKVSFKEVFVFSWLLVTPAAALLLAWPVLAQENGILVATPDLLLRTEADYQKHLNTIYQGDMEVRLKDKTRVDILTDTLAIEIDFAVKWYEAVGQAAHYSMMTGKQPAVLLIIKTPADEKYFNAAKRTVPKTFVNGQQMVLLVFRNYIRE